jgi:hypothetical protein
MVWYGVVWYGVVWYGVASLSRLRSHPNYWNLPAGKKIICLTGNHHQQPQPQSQPQPHRRYVSQVTSRHITSRDGGVVARHISNSRRRLAKRKKERKKRSYLNAVHINARRDVPCGWSERRVASGEWRAAGRRMAKESSRRRRGRRMSGKHKHKRVAPVSVRNRFSRLGKRHMNMNMKMNMNMSGTGKVRPIWPEDDRMIMSRMRAHTPAIVDGDRSCVRASERVGEWASGRVGEWANGSRDGSSEM